MPVRFYLDESVPVSIAAGLRRRGVDAVTARDVGNLGLDDLAQLRYATTAGRVLFTHDTDFVVIAHGFVRS